MAPTTDISALAHSVEADDLFVMRRVSGDRFVHLGGAGRGESWAGIVELRLQAEPAAAAAMREGRPVVLDHHPRTGRIFGPYHSGCALFMPVSNDVIVVFGGLAQAPQDHAPLCDAALVATEAIEQVSPAKRLADELEVLHAVRDMTDGAHATLDGAAQHAVRSAVAALSCESGALWLSAQDRAWWVLGERTGPLDLERASAALRDLREQKLPTCVQDAAEVPLPAPLAPLKPIAYYALSIDKPEPGLLLLIHTEEQPRGFTSLCQLLGRRLAAAAGPVLESSAHREQLEAEIARVNELARRDALTGLANRLAWDEAIDAYPDGAPAVVVVLDVDGLKAINDTHGHDAGDEVITDVARVLRAAVREDDLVARVGGDEFAVLLGADHSDSAIARINRSFIGRESHGLPQSVSIGCHKRQPGECLRQAQRHADDDMYARKQASRARSGAAAAAGPGQLG